MWNDIALSGAQSLLKNGVSFFLAQQQADAEKAWQKYNNAMTMLGNASNQNAIETNEILLRGRAANQRFEIDRSKYMTVGQAEASAAASDTEGRSVNAVIFDIERNASKQQAALKADLKAQYLTLDHQREASNFQTASNLDYSYIPQPSTASFLMGLSTDMLSNYRTMNKEPTI